MGKSLKIAVAALLSIFIAGELGLKYSATAGIITVLSIQKTKKETLRSAANRGMAYICALVLAAICFQVLGYTLPAFAVYLFLFAFLCMTAGWQEAISTDSVLITHFLSEKTMGLSMLGNETLLFVIGAGMGILVNLHLHSKEADFVKLADEVDQQIKGILHWIAAWLPQQGKEDNQKSGKEEGFCRLKARLMVEKSGFANLEETLRQAKLCAAANYNNTLLRKDTYQLDYIRMREQQTVVLKGICQNIDRIRYLPCQATAVALLFADVEQAYHKENTVEGLLVRLEALLEEMKREQLPQTREEFEARAILFYILMQLQELLMIKRRFMEGRSLEK